MAHLKPETWHGGMWICEAHGESMQFPDDVFDQDGAAEQCGVDVDDVFYEAGWWARLTAPGYTDATDWSGPFKTEKAALNYVYNLHDVDARGDDRGAGYEMQDNLDDDDVQLRKRDSLHGLEQSPPNRRVHNLYNLPDGRWVFRYGPTPLRFHGEEMFFSSRDAAVRAAVKSGWVVENNNRLRKPHTGGINGL
jgi:hypothetical protein